MDCNDNGIADSCDIDVGNSGDCNANGVPDECDIAVGTDVDCQPNGIPDECEPDADGDRVPDDCDLCPNTIPGAPVDANGCPPMIPGDCDNDGDVDDDDYALFIACANDCIASDATDNDEVDIVDLAYVKSKLFCSVAADLDCSIADVNADRLVDIVDLAFTKANLFCNDLAVVPAPGCEDKDLDNDGFLTHGDIILFKQCYSGENVPADPNCAD